MPILDKIKDFFTASVAEPTVKELPDGKIGFAEKVQNYFSPTNQLRIRDVLREMVPTTKRFIKGVQEIVTPSRGYTKEQYETARPTFKETLVSIPKIGAEIATGIGEALTRETPTGEEPLSLIEEIVRTPFGQKLADIGEKIKKFAKPKTVGEAAQMRVVDVLSVLPIGSLKVARGAAEVIAKSKNEIEIAKVLMNEVKGLTDDVAQTIARPLVQIDNVDEVERVLNKVDFTIHQAKAAPVISKDLQPLAQEARKYKSAEEFVREFEYHGGAKNLEGGKLSLKFDKAGGIFTTPSETTAKTWQALRSGELYQVYLGDKKLIDLTEPKTVEKIKGLIGTKYKVDGEVSTFTKNDYEFLFPEGKADWATFSNYIPMFEKMGYKGARIAEGFNVNTSLWEDIKPLDKVLTKSQLTDFYNQAVKEERGIVSKLPEGARKGETYTGPGEMYFVPNTRDYYHIDEAGIIRKLPEKPTAPLEEITDTVKASDQALEEARLNVEGLELTLESHPAKPLTKFVSRATGELPEVIGKETKISSDTGKVIKAGLFSQKGDDIVANQLGFEDLDSAQKSLDDYNKGRKRLVEAKQAYKELVQVKREQRLLEADTQKASNFLERSARKTDKEIESEAKKQAKLKIERIQQRAKERRESAHSDLRELEQSIYRMTPELVKETPAFQSQAILEANKANIEEIPTLPKIVVDTATDVKAKVGFLDLFRTPDRVLAKIGLGDHMRFLRNAYENYVAELPNHIDLIREWKNLLPAEGNKRIFRWLDGRDIVLNEKELAVGTEIKEYLADWAERLGLPDDNRIANYITHIFEPDFIKKEFDEELAKIIADKVPGSVYDPFLEKRLGKKGYIEDTWRALEAYAKRAVRKANIDPALEPIKEASKRLEQSQFDFVKKYVDRVNLRPTKLDTLADNTIKQIAGYRFGQRPTTSLTRFGRQMVYRGALGLNFGSALKNLTQGINTYAKLGEKYTAIGYIKLLTNIGSSELRDVGVLKQDIIQDKIVSAGKTTLQKLDKTLFVLFETAERINRGAAYWGAKTKAIDKGMMELQAIDYAKKIVRDTQFTYSAIDTPLILSSDLAKTLFQFGTFPIKQTEFLVELLKKKEWTGFIRYIAASLFTVYAVGEAFNIDLNTFNPLNYLARFGTPPTLALPTEIIKAVVDSPGYFGQKRDLSEKIEDVLQSTLIYIPAGIQAQKTYRGLKKYEKLPKTEQESTKLLKSTLLGGKNIEKEKTAAQKILEKYKIKSPSANRAKEILEKYNIK